MRIREAAIFAAYASIIVYGLSAIPSLLTESPLAPSNANAILMAPLSFAAVFFTAALYLRKRPLHHPSHGAALGALGAFAVYCITVLCLMAVFYSTVAQWSEDGQSGHIPGAFGLYAIVLSPVLMPATLFIGAFAGMMYVHVKRLLGFSRPVTQAKPARRRRRIGMALALTAMVVIAVPSMIFLGGLPALMLLGSLIHH